MAYREYPPPAVLHDWVKCFWTIEEEPSGRIQEIWPDGCAELFFSTGEIVQVHDDGSVAPFPHFAVIGLQTGIWRVRCDSAIRILSARLLPHLDRSWTPGHLEKVYSEIRPRLELGELEPARQILESWLLRQPRLEDELTAAFSSLYASDGAISIRDLASARHTTPRQLQRLFAGRLGISPKRMA